MNTANKNPETKDLIEVLLNKKLFIVSLTSLTTLLLVAYIVFLPNYFTSSALLKVSFPDNNQSSSGLSAYAGLASLAGVSLPTASEDKGMVAIEKIRSRSFLEHLISFEGVLENIVAAKYYDFDNKKVIFDNDIYDDKNKSWIGSKPSYLEAFEFYEEYMNISQNKATGFISLSYEHVSPQFAYDFITLILREINLLMKAKDIKESSDSLAYLEGFLRKLKTQILNFNLIK